MRAKMLTQMPDSGQKPGRMWKSSNVYKNGGEKDVQSEQGIEQ